MVRKARKVLVEHCEDWYGEKCVLMILIISILYKPVYAECFSIHLCNSFPDEDISLMSCSLIAMLVYLNSIVVNNSNKEHNKLIQAKLSNLLGTKFNLDIISHLSFQLFKILDVFQRKLDSFLSSELLIFLSIILAHSSDASALQKEHHFGCSCVSLIASGEDHLLIMLLISLLYLEDLLCFFYGLWRVGSNHR